MNVSLTPELEHFIQAKVAGGFYHSASEVVREGLRLLEEQSELKKKRIEMLNFEIDKGLSSIKAGNILSGEDVYNELVKRRKNSSKNDTKN